MCQRYNVTVTGFADRHKLSIGTQYVGNITYWKRHKMTNGNVTE